ncbi:hypothetical protein HY485_01185 [Candidatus Woesearchaeota archaeon]|nr:hypothetical protein [Candidatus Woesearchaeota archaeon]
MDGTNITKMHKHAQITLYILIGIVFLLAIGTGIYVTTKTTLKTTIIQPESNIKTYITDCLTLTSIDALKKLGEHGGYIDPTDTQLSLRKKFNLNENPTESDALYLTPDNDQPVIYWWHLKSKNTCKNCDLTTENTPTLEEEKTQIEQYTLQALPKCLNNFEPFLKQGYHITKGDKKISAALETTVRITLTMPTIISRDGTETKETTFETIIDIPFKQIHTLATEIIKDLALKQRLETLFLHALAFYSGVDATKLPPISEITHSPTTATWTTPAVEQNVQQLLASIMPMIHINGTNTKKQKNTPTTPFAKTLYDTFTYNLPNTDTTDYAVDFSLIDNKIYFDINPKTQNQLIPDTDKTSFPFDLAPPFQTNYYEFFYDISAPILIRINTPNALKKTGYNFYVATELNIRKNKNLIQYHLGEGTIQPLNSNSLKPSVTTTTNEFTKCTPKDDKTFLCQLDGKTYPEIRACSENCRKQTTQNTITEINTTFFCDTNQRTSGTIKITAIDATDKKPVSDAAISYYCGTQLACPAGATNSRGIFRQKMPTCYNGLLKITRDKYHPFTQPITTETDKRMDVTAEIMQIKTIPTTIRKAEVQINPESIRTCCTYSSLNRFEKITLNLKRIPQQPWEAPFNTQAIYEPNNPMPTINLIPGNYEIQATIIDDLGFVIPKKCKRIDLTTYMPDEDKIFKPATLTGLIINNETGYWKIDSTTLAKTEKIDFTAIKIPTPTCIDENCITPPCAGLGELGKTKEYTKQFLDKIWPRIILKS